MKINENGLNLIKSFEGLSLSPYHDDIDPPSICTIGYGTIMYENGEYVKLTDPDITEQRAVELLQWEVTDKAKQIDPLLRDDKPVKPEGDGGFHESISYNQWRGFDDLRKYQYGAFGFFLKHI